MRITKHWKPRLVTWVAALASLISLSALAQNDDMTGKVMTVHGPIAPEQLGLTLTHEHLIADFTLPDNQAKVWQDAGREWPQNDKEMALYQAPLTLEITGAVSMGAENRDNRLLKDEQTAIAEVTEFKWHGGQTLVDLTSNGLKRDPQALKRISEATGVNVVMSTGWYQQAWVGKGLDRMSVDELSKQMVRDISRGFENTGIRAGIIGEIYVTEPGSSYGTKLLQAVAKASNITGAPISLDIPEDHLDALLVLDALDVLKDAGADLDRVALGHANRIAKDTTLMLRLLKRGVYLQFDRLGDFPHVNTLVSDHDVGVAVMDLIKRGHLDKILLSQDVNSKKDLKAYGGSGYSFIPELYVPYLRRLGMPKDQIDHILIENPKRLLTFAAPQGE